MIGWKAWFTEGRTFTSKDSNWEDLPNDGVLAVLVFEGGIYTRYADGQDYYFMHEGTICCNNDTLETNKKRYPDVKNFKRGKWTSDENMKRIQQEARQQKSLEKDEDCGCN